MSLYVLVPRAMRRKTIQVALSDARNVPDVREQLAKLKTEHAKTARLLQAMSEAIEDTEALLGELQA